MRGHGGLLAIAAVLLLAGLGIAAWLGDGSSAKVHQTTHRTSTAAAPGLVTLHVIFPEGFTRADMAERIGAVRAIAIRRRHVRPRLTSTGYLAASVAAKAPVGFKRRRGSRSLEGFLFPATYDFTQATTARELVADQLAAFRKAFSTVNLRYARSKNLTSYDVLTIASMIEKEAVVPAERRLIAAVIYNRLHAQMPLGIDATIRYGLRVPGTQSLTKAELASVQHATFPRPAADADREPGASLDPRCRASRARRLPLFRPQAGQAPSLLHRERRGIPAQSV